MNNNENEGHAKTQIAMIAEYLKNGNSITPIEALNMFGCFRLGARIADIKERYGWTIASDRVTTPSGKRVASYRLVSGTAEE